MQVSKREEHLRMLTKSQQCWTVLRNKHNTGAALLIQEEQQLFTSTKVGADPLVGSLSHVLIQVGQMARK